MGDGGHHAKGSKKLPDALRYSPPQLSKYKASADLLDHPKGHHDKDQNQQNHSTNAHHTSNNSQKNDKNVANGHIPIAHPPPGQNHKKEGSPPRPTPPAHNPAPAAPTPATAAAAVPHNKRDTPPLEHHIRSPPEPSNGANHHQQSSIKGSPPHKISPPPKESKEFHKIGSQHPRAYDDYELERRRQQMDRQGWPARDTKDYLIGGIYGPQPKSKLPNDAQPARQHHTNSNSNDQRQESQPTAVTKLPAPSQQLPYQPPSNAANRAQARKQKAAGREPYRSRSYPREDRTRLNNVSRKQAGGAGGQRNNDPRSHSLMDLKGPPPPPPRSRNQSRGGQHPEEDYLLDEDDEDYVVDPPERNGPKYGPRRVGAGARSNRVFDGPVVTSELINSDAVVNKARVVMFYKNGDPFFPGVKVSLRGRDFASFEALCNHLTPRTDLPIGVRYIFTMDGEKVRDLEELEDGGVYVCSSRKKFVPLPYGTGQLGWKPHSKFKMEEDLKLFRPPSPGATAGNSSDGQPGSRGKRFIRVVNNDDQSLQIRHMLNSRTTQPFENMIQGMAETLRMPTGRKLYSYTGKHIQSYSQLRNELRDGDIFYLCSGESFGPTLPRYSETSRSLDETSMGRVGHPKGHRKSNRPGSAPDWQRQRR